jgi:hypothetical protein
MTMRPVAGIGGRLVALALAALVAPSAVAAKSSSEAGEPEVLELTNSPGEDMVSGREWTAELRIQPPELVQRAGERPAVLVLNERTGERRSFAVRRSGDRFTASVVFPEEGRWAYGVALGPRFVAGREYVDVAQAPARSDPRFIIAVSALLVVGALAVGASALRS